MRRPLKLPKRWRPCLKCSKKIFTDPYHRICPLCTLENEKVSSREARVTWAAAETLALADAPSEN
jgi:hypothetical protein